MFIASSVNVVLRIEEGENKLTCDYGYGQPMYIDGKIIITSSNNNAKLQLLTTNNSSLNDPPAIHAVDGSSINICGNANVVAKANNINDVLIGGNYGSSTNINIGGNANVVVEANDVNGVLIGGENVSTTNINIGGNVNIVAKVENVDGALIGGKNVSSTNINIGGNANVVAKANGVGDGALIGGEKTSLTVIEGESHYTINIGGNCHVIAVADSSYYNRTIGATPPHLSTANISITGGFVIMLANHYLSHLVSTDNSPAPTITGGSVFCQTVAEEAHQIKNASGNSVYPCYCPRNIDGIDLLDKEISVPLEDGSSYKAKTLDNKTLEIMQDNDLADLPLLRTLSACLWLPQKDYYDQIRISGVSSKTFKSNVAANINSYEENTGPDNWLEVSSSEITPPVLNPDMSVPTVDTTTPVWFSVRNPILTGTGTPGFTIVIKNEDGDDILGEGVVDSNGRWQVVLSDIPDAAYDALTDNYIPVVVVISQIDEFFQNISYGLEKDIRVDTVNPEAEISIETNFLEAFVNVLTFGLFCKDRAHVQIHGRDNASGLSNIEYAVIDHTLSMEEAVDLDFRNDVPLVDNSISLEFNPDAGQGEADFNESFFIYVKVTDRAGNKFYINSDSITIYYQVSDLPSGVTPYYGGSYYGGSYHRPPMPSGASIYSPLPSEDDVEGTIEEVLEGDAMYDVLKEDFIYEGSRIVLYKFYKIAGNTGDFFRIVVPEEFITDGYTVNLGLYNGEGAEAGSYSMSEGAEAVVFTDPLTLEFRIPDLNDHYFALVKMRPAEYSD